MESAHKLVLADRSSLFLTDSERNILWSTVAHGSSKPIEIPMHKGIAGWVATHKETLNISNCYDDPRFNHRFSQPKSRLAPGEKIELESRVYTAISVD